MKNTIISMSTKELHLKELKKRIENLEKVLEGNDELNVIDSDEYEENIYYIDKAELRLAIGDIQVVLSEVKKL